MNNISMPKLKSDNVTLEYLHLLQCLYLLKYKHLNNIDLNKIVAISIHQMKCELN